MCGICGYYNFNLKPIKVETLEAMCEVIRHRGPDDEGVFIDGPFGMGMRRLSIIDLATGHQPISNEDGSIWTVLNGEIYNYLELTKELLKKGHIFKTKSDTEVLVHLYEEYGYEFVKYLRGMFGLALWDKKNKELIIARDPLGIKQLYFKCDDGKFIFGSEIKCILKVSNVYPQINYEAMQHYLTFLYFPEDLTIFDKIIKLKPGMLLRITLNQVKSYEYWNLNKFQPLNLSFEEAQDEFMRLMNESMKLHLRSDVPIGVFLSGGIDSSIITALGAKLTDKPLNTFTIGYGKEGGYYDERHYAKIVARLFRTNHFEYIVKPDIENAIYKLINYFDEPFANSSAIPNYYISQIMSKEVKVALSGLGGDEIGGGYERYLGLKLLLQFNKLPTVIKSLIKSFICTLPDSKTGSYFSDRCKRFVNAAALKSSESYYGLITSLDITKKSKIFTQSFLEKPFKLHSRNLYLNIIKSSNQTDILKSAMYFDLVSYMTNDLLILTDRTSMANSLEVRVPFLDQKLVEFMFQLPMSYKIRGMQKKYLFKSAFRGILPERILFRRKRGFSTPLSIWLRNDQQIFSKKILVKERIQKTEVLNFDGIQSLLNEHLARKANNQGIIFALLTFVIWHEKYIQGKDYAMTC
ncbi:MAG: asparagine synthase (glutamine-hydrolyzing) [Nanoarchaeota archaeon]